MAFELNLFELNSSLQTELYIVVCTYFFKKKEIIQVVVNECMFQVFYQTYLDVNELFVISSVTR